MKGIQRILHRSMVRGESVRRSFLTSPRREASLFKLGRAFGFGQFLLRNVGAWAPPPVANALIRRDAVGGKAERIPSCRRRITLCSSALRLTKSSDTIVRNNKIW